jgi:hypothetical protein
MQRKRLQEISSQIEGLQSARDKEAGHNLSSEELEALRVKLEATLKKLDNLKEAGEDAWRDLRIGLEKAAADLKKGVEKAVAEFGRKQQ